MAETSVLAYCYALNVEACNGDFKNHLRRSLPLSRNDSTLSNKARYQRRLTNGQIL